jgi:hypothetical protein
MAMFDMLLGFGAKEAWRSFFAGSEHILLEKCEMKNDFADVQELVKKNPERLAFFDFHVKMSTGVFKWDNFQAWRATQVTPS